MSTEAPSYSYANVETGDSVAPLLRALPAFQTRLDPLAGRPILLCLLPSIASPEGRAALEQLAAEPKLADLVAARILVSAEEGDVDGLATRAGFDDRFLDRGFKVLRAFGATPRETSWTGGPEARVGWVILGPSLHILTLGSFLPLPDGRSRLSEPLQRLAEMLAPYSAPRPPPILLLPNVFSPALCAALVEAYDRNGGTETGVVINNALALNPDMKKRRDYTIQEPELLKATHVALSRRIIPEIERLFFMKIARIERNIVACYAAADGAHFLRPHRDNLAPGTAHRRFAVSVNLTGGFEGGEVVFPEYGAAGYKAPPGWALIFPCNVVHLVTRVEAGARYVWLPFIYE